MSSISFSSVRNGKVITFPKSEQTITAIQNFLKKIKVKKDYRKNFLKYALSSIDKYEESSNKEGSIILSAFTGKSKIIVRITWIMEKEEEICKLIAQEFT